MTKNGPKKGFFMKSEVYVTATGLELTTTQPNWSNDSAVLWALICTVHLTACSCHVTYAFQSESTLYFAPTSSKEFLDKQATIECGFTLKRLRDMARTYSQIHRTDTYSQHSSTIWSVWLWVRLRVQLQSPKGSKQLILPK